VPTQPTEIIAYVDPQLEGQRLISGLEDASVRTQALALWEHAPDLASENKRFLPVTVVQIADQFSDQDPLVARSALSAAGILLAEGELSNSGFLDDQEQDSISDFAEAIIAMGLEGVDASFLADYFGINTSLGGLLGLEALNDAVLNISPEDIAQIRAELVLDLDDRDDYEDEEADHDEFEADVTDPTGELPRAAIEAGIEDMVIDNIQELLGRIGLTGVDIITIADYFAVPLDTADSLEELGIILTTAGEDDIESLLTSSDADFIDRRPQDIAGALAIYRSTIASIKEEEIPSDGTVTQVVDDSGDVFEI
jgi:hypothetical protein